MIRKDNGTIVQIQNFSVNDGQGIRSTIFLMGCPLRCQWCSNPETWLVEPQVIQLTNKILRCTDCQNIVKDLELLLCPECNGRLINENRLYSKTLGFHTTTSEIIKKIKRQEVFYRHSKGGVTLSGGEPTFQSEFFNDLVYQLDNIGINLTLETCGYFDYDSIASSLELFSHIFFDLKVMDDNKHIMFTGVSNQLIIANLLRIKKLGIPITIRVPLITEINANDENIDSLISFLLDNFSDYPLDLELLTYHNLGKDKYDSLNLHNTIFNKPLSEDIRRLKNKISTAGITLIEYR